MVTRLEGLSSSFPSQEFLSSDDANAIAIPYTCEQDVFMLLGWFRDGNTLPNPQV